MILNENFSGCTPNLLFALCQIRGEVVQILKKKEIQVTQNALANGRSSLHDSCRRAVVILDRKFQEIAMLASWRPHGASSFRLYYIFLYFFFNPLALLDNSLSLATTPNLLTNLKYTTFPPHISTIFHHCL